MELLGIKEIFTLHGGHLDTIYQACLSHNFRVFDTRHEQAAAHMADGWARHTGRPGVCVVTAGPGVTDAVTGVANAMMDAIPLVCIGGRSPLRDDETLPLQGVNQMGLMAAITKWQHSVKHVERIPEFFAMAYRHAVSGRPGPVFLELPIDVLFQRVAEDSISFVRQARPEAAPAGSPSAVAKAMDLLRQARRPAILAGGGVFFSGGWAELTEFAEVSGIPVFTNSKARGCIPDDHPLCGGSFQTLGAARMLGEEGRADVVLILGARLGLFTGGKSDSVIAQDATIIQVDAEPEEIGRNREVTLGIAGDCREVLLQLIAAAQRGPAVNRNAWQVTIQQVRRSLASMFAAKRTDDSRPIHQHRLMADIVQAVPGDAIFVADGGETASWFSDVVTVRKPGHWLSHGYLGCLGVGIPFALACKAASPDKAVVCVTGDGSVGLNLAEFHTAVKHNLPVIVVVNNDQGWGMSKHGQEILFGRDRLVAVDLGPVTYEKAAEGLGAYGERVEQASEVVPAMQRALMSGRVACLNVMTDPNVVAPITQALYSALLRSEEKKSGGGDETTLPYYGRRQLDRE
jgi:acetolactate synthase-1/2/3 large subunit